MIKDLTNEMLIDIIDEEEVDGYKLIEQDEWEVDGKCQHMSVIFQHEEKFYKTWVSRQGSYHTDYEYVYPTIEEIEEVEKVEVVKTEWRVVK